MLKRNLFCIFMLLIGCLCALSQSAPNQFHNLTNENSHEASRKITQKGMDRYGKISNNLMDEVFFPEWRNGRLRYRLGMDVEHVHVQIGFDSNKLEKAFFAETEFYKESETDDNKNMIGSIPGGKLLSLNDLPGIFYVVSPGAHIHQHEHNSAPVVMFRSNPEFLQQSGVYSAWQKWGKGKGVKVGIIDGGFINLHTLLDADILPKEQIHLRTVLNHNMAKRFPLGTGIHGTAVAEVIHEVAPEAEIYLYPTALSPVAWEKAVQLAIEDGVDVINSSLNSTYGALDNRGDPNTLLDPAIEAGIVYCNSAGNNGMSCYNASFMDLDGNGWHNYTPEDEGNSIFLNKGDYFQATLTWDDYGCNPSFANSDQDLDLYLFYVDPKTHEPIQLFQSQHVQQSNLDISFPPVETISTPNEGAPHTGLYTLMIKAHKIDLNRRIDMRLLVTAPDRNNPQPNIFKTIQYRSTQKTMTKPADHPGVITVAASGLDRNVHIYSGTGPADNRNLKPDITGYSGLYTTSFESAFFGTSCASPFVAGCAALLWQEYPDVKQIKEELIQRATKPSNTGEKGHDPSSGWGVVSLFDNAIVEPTAQLVSISRINNVTTSSLSGFDLDVNIVCKNAINNKIFIVLYMLDSSQKLVPCPEGANAYKGPNGELRISSYLIPNKNTSLALKSRLFIPTAIYRDISNETSIELRVESESGRVLSKKTIGPIGILVGDISSIAKKMVYQNH